MTKKEMATRNTKKEQAYRAVYDAIDKVREYRGLPVNRELFNCYGERHASDTTAHLMAKAQNILLMLNEPIPAATEKQIALLVNFSKKEMHQELRGVENWKINKFQASELITECINLKNAAYGHASSYNVFVQEDLMISAILEKIEK